MLIKIAMGFFSLLILIIATYLSRHVEEPFVKIKPDSINQYKLVTKSIAILFFISAIFGFVTLFFDSKMLSISALLFGSICAAFYAIFISNKFHV